MAGETRSMAVFLFPDAEGGRACVWRPSADVYRTRDGWLVKLDLAGVRPQDVAVTAHGSRLHVSGVRHDWLIEEGWNYHAMEISYCRFERVIELPADLGRAEISAECREGMLLLRVRAEGAGAGRGDEERATSETSEVMNGE
jgi:HSP20 family protein